MAAVSIPKGSSKTWAELERDKRNKRENDIIEYWDDRILRDAQRLVDMCGKIGNVRKSLISSGFDKDEINNGIRLDKKKHAKFGFNYLNISFVAIIKR